MPFSIIIQGLSFGKIYQKVDKRLNLQPQVHIPTKAKKSDIYQPTTSLGPCNKSCHYLVSAYLVDQS